MRRFAWAMLGLAAFTLFQPVWMPLASAALPPIAPPVPPPPPPPDPLPDPDPPPPPPDPDPPPPPIDPLPDPDPVPPPDPPGPPCHHQPEPGTLGLLALGAGIVGLRSLRRKRCC